LITIGCGFDLACHMPAVRQSLSNVRVTFKLMPLRTTVQQLKLRRSWSCYFAELSTAGI
jgi:hypothetical protein